jgi:hypothetical protein
VHECLLIDFMCAGLFGLCWIATKLKKDLLCCFVCCVPDDDEDEDDEGEIVLRGLSHHHHSDSSRPVKRRRLDDRTASHQSQHTVGTPVQSPLGNRGSHVYIPPTALSSPSGHNLAPNATSLSISHGINIQHPSHNQLTPNTSASQNHSQSHSGGDESSMFRTGASSEVMTASSYYTHAMMIQMQQQREHQQPQQHYQQQQRMQQQHQHQPLMADQPSVESLAVLSVGAGGGREEREVDDGNSASAADAAAMVVNSVDEMLRDIDCSEADTEDTSQPPDHFSIAMI